jgi:hypothetical protein
VYEERVVAVLPDVSLHRVLHVHTHTHTQTHTFTLSLSLSLSYASTHRRGG